MRRREMAGFEVVEVEPGRWLTLARWAEEQRAATDTPRRHAPGGLLDEGRPTCSRHANAPRGNGAELRSIDNGRMPEVSSREWFNIGNAAFRRSFPRIAHRVGADPFYVCPLCLMAHKRVAQLTREHVPPESIGGCRMVLICKHCNDRTGHEADIHLKREADVINFLSGGLKRAKAHLRTDTGRVPIDLSTSGKGIRVVGIPRATHPLTHRRVMDAFAPAAPGATPITFKIELPAFSERRADAAWLKAAYLAFFAAFGYRFVLRPELDLVRERIRHPASDKASPCRLLQPNLSTPQLLLIDTPARFRSFGMLYERNLVLLPRGGDAELYNRLRDVPADVRFSGLTRPWPRSPLHLFDK